MEYLINLATKQDIDKLAKLLHELFSQDIEFTPDIEKQKKGLKKIISNNNIGEILVLRLDNEIIGMVSLLYSVSTVLGERVSTLEDMIIKSNYRNKGYGTILLNRAIKWAKEKGSHRITLLTDHNNNVAIKYYESNGFKKSPMIPMRNFLV